MTLPDILLQFYQTCTEERLTELLVDLKERPFDPNGGADVIPRLEKYPYSLILEKLWTEEHKRLYTMLGVPDSESFTYDNLEHKLRQCLYPSKPTQIDKIWGLLADDQGSMRNQGIQLFLTLSVEEQRMITSRYVQIDGRHPSLIHRTDSQQPERVSFIPPVHQRHIHGLEVHIDWMMAIAGDPRWLSAKKLHVQYMIAQPGFSQSMVEELLAHLLHHPNLEELYLMNGYLNATDLLADLRSFGMQSATVTETIRRLQGLRSFTTSYIYHPFLAGFNLTELVLEGRGIHEQWLRAPDTYNRFTHHWRNWYWSGLKYVSINENKFSHLQKLKLSDVINCYEVQVDSDLVQEIHLSQLSNLEVCRVSHTLSSLHIDQCPSLFRLTISLPKSMYLRQNLMNGLGPSIDSDSPDWLEKFAELQQSQKDTIHIVQVSDFPESNAYFHQVQEAMDHRCYFTSRWLLERIFELFTKGQSFHFHVTKGDYAFWSEQTIVNDVGFWESRGYCNWDDFEDLSYDWYMNTKVLEQPTLQEGLSEAIVTTIADVLHGRSEWESCDTDTFLHHEGVFEIIFSSIEAEQFWTWIQMMPQEFQDAVEGLK